MSETIVKKPYKISDLEPILSSDIDDRDRLLISDYDANEGKKSKALLWSTLKAYFKQLIPSTITQEVIQSPEMQTKVDASVTNVVEEKVVIQKWNDNDGVQLSTLSLSGGGEYQCFCINGGDANS